jgi:hypothetical protein
LLEHTSVAVEENTVVIALGIFRHACRWVVVMLVVVMLAIRTVVMLVRLWRNAFSRVSCYSSLRYDAVST